MYPGNNTVNSFGPTIFGCEGLTLGIEEREFFKQAQPFAFILFTRNIKTTDQVKRLCDDLRNCVNHNAPIMVDQEGGRVQRFRPPLASEWTPPLNEIKNAKENAERVMYLRYLLIAHELKSLGVDANCAPVLDVFRAETHPFLKNRCYSDDPDQVAKVGRAVANGLLDGGVLPVVKHIPGHGRSILDSHRDLPRIKCDKLELKNDFRPFGKLNDLPMGMTAHLVFEAFDKAPVTTSARMIEVIRNQICFNGLIMTDDISMQALSGSLKLRTENAIAAGCDMVLHCNGRLGEMREVAEASGMLQKKSFARANAAMSARKLPEQVDISAITAELKTL
ncbi:beta-N-acetylhexosaminidase [Pseudopelagicola sp. nBUS_20]|uniref:beta-N-acetylhexosaminidase n=1 Tax=Pseudopelagicola sp. nBUS_20 TaxID=3395317 RepID=UPI003EBECC06